MKIDSRLLSAIPFGAFVALALLAGCATRSGPTITSHRDAAVNYFGYKTFAVIHPTTMSAARNRTATPAALRQMREEAGNAFAAKGLSRVPEADADLLVLAHGAVDEKIDITDFRLPRGPFGRYDINQYKEGTLFIDVFDAKTHELIWRGTAVAEVGETPDAGKLKASIDAVVARYPN